VSEETPAEYVRHLEERNYDHHVVGKKHIDIEQALWLLSEKYGIKTILVDTGQILGNLLLNHGFVNEISLLIHPVIVGATAYNMFSRANNMKLKLCQSESLENDHVWLVYAPEA